jgi:hypothetical protein
LLKIRNFSPKTFRVSELGKARLLQNSAHARTKETLDTTRAKIHTQRQQQQQKEIMSESFAYGASEDPTQFEGNPLAKLRIQSSQRLQRVLDRSVPFTGKRWAVWCFLCLAYFLRAYFVHGYYIVTYGLGIYNLNLVIGFLSPARDPAGGDGPTLPSSNNEEYR